METDSGNNKNRVGHETRDADTRTLGYSAAGLFLILVLILVFTRWLFFYFEARQPLGPPPTPFDTMRALPPEPRLQVAPVEDLQGYLQEQQSILHGYGWADQQSGAVRIPIDRAKELLLERGLPARQQPPQGDSSGVPTDSGGPDTSADTAK